MHVPYRDVQMLKHMLWLTRCLALPFMLFACTVEQRGDKTLRVLPHEGSGRSDGRANGLGEACRRSERVLHWDPVALRPGRLSRLPCPLGN